MPLEHIGCVVMRGCVKNNATACKCFHTVLRTSDLHEAKRHLQALVPTVTRDTMIWSAKLPKPHQCPSSARATVDTSVAMPSPSTSPLATTSMPSLWLLGDR